MKRNLPITFKYFIKNGKISEKLCKIFKPFLEKEESVLILFYFYLLLRYGSFIKKIAKKYQSCFLFSKQENFTVISIISK